MYSVGLTSGIGCGKTLISNVFKSFGIPVFNSDLKAKEVYKEKEFLQEIIQTFGNTIIENGEFRAQKLADIVFNDSQALEKLNQLIHPKVLDKYLQWQRQYSTPYTILESAIIFESGWQKHFNKIITITTPIEVVIERVKLRDNTTEEEIKQRINNQLSIEKREQLSDYVIIHDGKTMILPQIIEIHQEIIKQIK
jgi:dephospho-CoA kinase